MADSALRAWRNAIQYGRRQALLLFGIVGAALCGYLGWGFGLTPLAAMVVPIWSQARSRPQAWAIMFAYYLAGSRVLPASAAVFFGKDSSLALGLLLWTAAAGLLSLPWGLLALNSRRWQTVPRLLAAIVAVSIPPLGLIGWLNPLLGAALIIPGYGWGSIAVGLLCLSLLAWTRHLSPGPAMAILAAGVVAGIAAWATASPPDTLPGWTGMTLRAGGEPISAEQLGARQLAIVDTVDTALAAGHRVIVLPEQILGVWDESWGWFLEGALGEELRSRGAVVILGTALPAGRGRTANSLIAYDGQVWQRFDARHAVPVSMWKPWGEGSTEVHWLGRGVHQVLGTKFMLSMCFEDFLMWLPMLSFASDQPRLIVSAANAWWARNTRAQEIQYEHVAAWARIFGVPLVRALNAS